MTPSRVRSTSSLRALPFQGDNAALVAALLRRHPGAAAVFHQRFARKVHGLLFRILGPDSELEDTLQDTFVRALEALPKLRDPEQLDGWLMGVAVRAARTRLQKRARRAWLRIVPSEELSGQVAPTTDPITHESLKATYRVLDRLPIDQRMALVLRFAAEMTLVEAAEACGVSLATIKRRLSRAEQAFREQAETEPSLTSWLEAPQA